MVAGYKGVKFVLEPELDFARPYIEPYLIYLAELTETFEGTEELYVSREVLGIPPQDWYVSMCYIATKTPEGDRTIESVVVIFPRQHVLTIVDYSELVSTVDYIYDNIDKILKEMDVALRLRKKEMAHFFMAVSHNLIIKLTKYKNKEHIKVEIRTITFQKDAIFRIDLDLNDLKQFFGSLSQALTRMRQDAIPIKAQFKVFEYQPQKPSYIF